MKIAFAILLFIFLFPACSANRRVSHVSTVPHPPERIFKKDESFWKMVGHQMRFKNITPKMEVQLEDLIEQGCVPEYEMLENNTAYMYSIIPGGGQIYTGEPKKALMYILSSVLIVPYIVSFEDTQRSVDYLNLQYSIDYCKKKLHLSKKMEERAKNRAFIDQINQTNKENQ